MKKRFFLILSAAVFLFGALSLLKFGNFGTGFLWEISSNGEWLFPLVTVAALLDSINPCALSILLLTIAFLFSLGKMRSSILQIGGVYIFGIFVAYVLIGLGILQVLHFFDTPHFMAKVGAALLIAFGGMNVVNALLPAFPVKLQIPQSTHKWMAFLMEKASLPAAFFLGVLVGLCEFPCTGGPYLMVLGLLHDQATYLKGLAYLVYYNLLFVLPLALLLLLASEKLLLDKVNAWRKQNIKGMRLWVGAAMILLGAVIFLL